MTRIISVSRRTDVPAFYPDWFMNRLKDGFAGYVNPFSGKRHLVSLEPEDVLCFVFWSKDLTPFRNALKYLDRTGYKFYFHYTITGFPGYLESGVTDTEKNISFLIELSDLYSADRVVWRYDPIVMTSELDHSFHVRNFMSLAGKLKGRVKRCYFSFVQMYGKVKKNFDLLKERAGINILEPDTEFRAGLASELAVIAEDYGIELYSCCGDELVRDRVRKAHCVDRDLVSSLSGPQGRSLKEKPTREGCGCAESTDIGAYDTCVHGCVYCYANINKEKASSLYKEHDKDSAFLGYPKDLSDKWLKELE
ncbi:MAG: DUF1848 domain-containing protein [bacterium]|nr:DUF1848 domain-containing protein [bacterium]